jgi:hypothetical protein
MTGNTNTETFPRPDKIKAGEPETTIKKEKFIFVAAVFRS